MPSGASPSLGFLVVFGFYLGVCRGFVTADVLEKGLSRGAIATG